MNKNNRKSGTTLIELVVAIVIAIVSVGIFAAAVTGVVGTSDGKRVGVLSKFSHKGLFIKSYEGS